MNALTLGAAFLLGLAASAHCLVMCGGITAALGMATAKDAHGRTRPAARHLAGSVLLVSALLTFAGPWLEHSMPGVHAWLPFDCAVR